MQLKEGVIWTRNVHPAVWRAQLVLDSVTQATVGRRAVVTSAEDGRHSTTSLHYRGRALDLRTRDLTARQAREYAKALREALGAEWEVFLEHDHIHIEYDYDVAVDQ